MNLSTLAPGALFKVIKVLWDKEVGRRLADMGFTEGAEGQVVRSGFLRGPFQVQIRGYDLLIRRCEAAGIEVEYVGEAEVPKGGPGQFFNTFALRRGLGPGCGDLGSQTGPRQGRVSGRGLGGGRGRGGHQGGRQGGHQGGRSGGAGRGHQGGRNRGG